MEQPQPQEVLPLFLFLTVFTIMADTIARRSIETAIVPMLLVINSITESTSLSFYVVF